MQQANRSNNLSLAPTRQEVALSDLWLILRKRRSLILALSVIAMLVAGSASYLKGKSYTAKGEIQVQPGSASGFKEGLSVALSGTDDVDLTMESDSRILRSDRLMLMVISDLRLQNDAVFMEGHLDPPKKPGQPPLFHGDLSNPYVRNAMLKIMRRDLSVSRIPRTRMIQITFTSKSPQLATNVVNTLASEFIKSNFTEHFNSTQQVSNWLSGQIDDLRNVVQSSQDKMVDLQKRLGISAVDPQHNTVTDEITGLQKNATDATQQRVLLEARYRILQSLPRDQILDSAATEGRDSQGILASLRAQSAADQADLARMTTIYGPNYPQVKQLAAHLQALRQEINAQEVRVLAQAKDSASIANATEAQARKLLDARLHEIYGQRDDIVQYELLSQEYESNRRMYESILTRLREAAVDAGLDAADISIVDLAPIPVDPSSMPLRTVLFIGLAIGFCSSIVVALVLEQLDTRMRDSKQIQDLLGVPALAVLPQSAWRTRDEAQEQAPGPELLWDARSSFAEAIRVLRTSIQLSSVARQSRVIAITSCQPTEGKSTVATNLAAALAQGGKRVILVDTDMRRPSVYWRLGLTVKRGLSEYLTGNEPLDNIIQTHQTLANLDLIPSGFSPPLPADLLSSNEMKQLVLILRDRYEYVIFDTPPALSVTDPLIVAALSDGLVLVTRQGYCTRAMLGRAAEIFTDVDVKVYGFILNGVDASLPEYYGYLGYYSYDYK